LTFEHIPYEKLLELKWALDGYLSLRERQEAQQRLGDVQTEIEGVELELSEVNGQLTAQDELVKRLQQTVDLNGLPDGLLQAIKRNPKPVASKAETGQKSAKKETPSKPELVKDEAAA
jgi:hypothetical protein